MVGEHKCKCNSDKIFLEFNCVEVCREKGYRRLDVQLQTLYYPIQTLITLDALRQIVSTIDAYYPSYIDFGSIDIRDGVRAICAI